MSFIVILLKKKKGTSNELKMNQMPMMPKDEHPKDAA